MSLVVGRDRRKQHTVRADGEHATSCNIFATKSGRPIFEPQLSLSPSITTGAHGRVQHDQSRLRAVRGRSHQLYHRQSPHAIAQSGLSCIQQGLVRAPSPPPEQSRCQGVRYSRGTMESMSTSASCRAKPGWSMLMRVPAEWQALDDRLTIAVRLECQRNVIRLGDERRAALTGKPLESCTTSQRSPLAL